jgi:hypothetical protein
MMDCAELREVAPEVALGLLTGEERAAALAHLQRCEACRAEVASLAGTADEVLLAAPRVEPPPGFRDAVLARLASEGAGGDGLPTGPARPGAGSPDRNRRRGGGPGRAGRHDRSRRRVALALAAAVAVVAMVAGGLVAFGGRAEEPPTVAVAEMRTGSGEVVGEASASGDPATVVVAVPGWSDMVASWGDPASDTYWMSVELADGSRSMSAVHPSRDSWTVRLDSPADEVVTISVLDQEGRVWCSGRFTV